MARSQRRGVVPPFLLDRIARATGPGSAPRAARATLNAQEPGRRAAIEASGSRQQRVFAAEPNGGLERAVYDGHEHEQLPGSLARSEGEPATGDAAVDEAYSGLGDTYRLFDEAFSRSSIDGQGMPLHATVHYGNDYDNAFWNGTQMVFGDGDGEVFRRFTISLSVIGHELTHGVTGHTAALRYVGQSGALSESVSDVFGCLVEQYSRQETSDGASWLVGEGLFTDQVRGTALRSLKAPGTAYDDDVLGKDPQPATMTDYVETDDDDGGVHINSGIPNHAFYLLATTLGGHAWEVAGRIWYDALTHGTLAHDATFAEFATATIDSARALFGAETAAAVRDAWTSVEVTPEHSVPLEQDSSPRSIVVERSGGVAGVRRSWRAELDERPEGARLRTLIETVDWARGLHVGEAGADGFRYRIRCLTSSQTCVLEAQLAESELTTTWRELIERVRESDSA
ncbi:thermolysin metallopeptidase-like protein [Paramicrobacterium agarici]|nr:thermolysin metallopeptidase-like protein [Microbacterium agarici]